jgi:hypothetical protein
MNSTWDNVDEYFSGQGIVLIAERGEDGNPMGFEPIGNVSALTIGINTNTLEHKESKTGQRGTDLRLTTETTVSLSMTAENFIAKNLARVLRGTRNVVPGATVTDQPLAAYPGKVSGLNRIKLTALILEQGASPLVAYVDDVTAWDYKANAAAGSILLNDGSVTAPSILGAAVSAIGVGATTSVTAPNSARAGDEAYVYGVTGADAANLNGKVFTVLSATPTGVVLDFNSTGDVFTVTTAKILVGKQDLLATYTYESQTRVDSLTEGAKEVFMRFEGLNTAKGNAPVVVQVFKFSTDPLQELALISDEVQQFVLEGSVLLDATRTTGSKYFEVLKAT